MSALRPRTLALGTWLATRGALARLGIVMAVLGALACVVVAVALAGAGGGAAAQLPLVESSAIAWSAGVVLAFGGALHALHDDHDHGVIALARTRGASMAAYARGRVGGLVLLLSLGVGGATLVGGIAATSVAHAPLAAARTSAAGCVYALAFAATLGPVAMALLGVRRRAGGFFLLLAVLGLPELMAPWTAELLPPGWRELTSIPAALAAVRAGVLAPGAMAAPMVRAVAALAAIVAPSLLVVVARTRRGDQGETP
jgi:hypothetical protein